ncbi:MAG: hypothetical protein XD53_0617 [Petrotoga mobilis]|jgi:hypothetical protein|nr:MAG: hypothetical protein XD53_0617 [Petrotoga mobilis]
MLKFQKGGKLDDKIKDSKLKNFKNEWFGRETKGY